MVIETVDHFIYIVCECMHESKATVFDITFVYM